MLDFDSSIIVVFVMIIVLHFVLSKVFFNPVRKIMEERKSRIRENRESCEKALQENEQRINEIEEKLRSAKKTSDLKKQEFEKEAFKEKNRLLEEIHIESRDKVEKAKKQFGEQIKSLKKELESESEIFAERIEQRLLH